MSKCLNFNILLINVYSYESFFKGLINEQNYFRMGNNVGKNVAKKTFGLLTFINLAKSRMCRVLMRRLLKTL